MVPPELAAQLAASIASADADVRAARRGLSQFEEQYAQWAAEYARRAQELRAFEEGASARKPSSDVIHRREFLRNEVGVATQALERGVVTLQGAQRELESARGFFLRLVDLASPQQQQQQQQLRTPEQQQQQHLRTAEQRASPARATRARTLASPAVEAGDDSAQERDDQDAGYELPQDEPPRGDEHRREEPQSPASPVPPTNSTRAAVAAATPPHQHPVPPPLPIPRLHDATELRRRYVWNDRSQYVPEDFTFPKCNVDTMWELWCRGDAAKSYPPFRLLRGSDLPTANARKRLSDLRLLMAEVEKLIHAKGCWVDCPTSDQAANMLRAVKPDIGLITVSTRDKRRRTAEDLSWLSAVDAVRQTKKKLKQTTKQGAQPVPSDPAATTSGNV